MTFRAYNKYLVLKQQDIKDYLSPEEQALLEALCARIYRARIARGKPPWRNYVVVNADKPYGGQVWELIRKDVEGREDGGVR